MGRCSGNDAGNIDGTDHVFPRVQVFRMAIYHSHVRGHLAEDGNLAEFVPPDFNFWRSVEHMA